MVGLSRAVCVVIVGAVLVGWIRVGAAGHVEYWCWVIWGRKVVDDDLGQIGCICIGFIVWCSLVWCIVFCCIIRINTIITIQ